MIREYMNELILENDEKLRSLEQQLNDSMNDLDCAEKWLENLQIEANVDKNIFSPRAAEADFDGKMEEAQGNINKIKQDIEYIKSFMETHFKKKQEYDRLLAELDEMSGAVSTEQTIDSTMTQEAEPADSLKQIVNFLDDLYKKTDSCLALLYSDRLKCKNELKDMKSAIRKIADSLKKEI